MRTLLVIAKAPLAGFAKTRLAADGVPEDVVVELADAFLRDTARTARRVRDVEVAYHYAPESERAYFAALDPDALLVPQVDGDLGSRVRAAFEGAFELGASRAIAIGMDTPHLEPAVIERAFGELDRVDVVLGPARDGGYYLVGMCARAEGLFARIPWSTGDVLTTTLARAKELGLATRLLPEVEDLDDLASLARLERELGPDGEPCPATARVLSRWRARGRRA